MIKIVWITSVVLLCASVSNAPAQQEHPDLTFGLIADIQYADCAPKGARYYRNSLKKADECVSYLNKQDLGFTINLGDIIDRDFADMDSILGCLNHLKKPIYHITGNHDYKGLKDNRVLYKRLRMPSEYYSFTKKDWVFIMLNTNEIAAYSNIKGTEKESELSAMLDRIKSKGEPQGASWNGGISKKQLAWLNKLLLKANKAGKKVLIFSHHPLYPQTKFAALNSSEILDVVKAYSCVKAIFSGHHHLGNFAYYNGLPVITIEGMVETEKENAYGLVKLYENKIVVEGKDRLTSRILEYNTEKSDRK